MANGILPKHTATCTVLVLMVLIQASVVWQQGTAAPAKRNDILAGTEFLSVFINGAMAPSPQRRRGSRRGAPAKDNVAAESRQQEASIYRISRTSNARPMIANGHNLPREEGVRYYPISQKSLENSQNLASFIDDLSTVSEITSKLTTQTENPSPTQEPQPQPNRTIFNPEDSINQKVIGVSVTSSVEATPYRVRVEHYDPHEMAVVTRPPSTRTTDPPSTTPSPSTSTSSTTFATTMAATVVTEEFSNIVSESNRSEFSVEEGSPRTSWRDRGKMTPRPTSRPQPHSLHRHHKKEMSDSVEKNNSERTEESYEASEQNSEIQEDDQEPMEVPAHLHQGRKVGRHYDGPLYSQLAKSYSQPSKVYSKPARVYSEPAKMYGEPAKMYSEPEKVYGEPSKVYSEPAKIYSEPAKVYSEPAKVYGEPAKVYGEPEKIYSLPSKVYSEPAKVYSEPSKVYSEPALIYGEPSKVYGLNGRPLNLQEPDEENYEVDEEVSVGSNGNVHDPRTTNPEIEDGHKIGYVVEDRNYRMYRVEERTPDGFIVGEYGVLSHDDGSLRGVRYTADGTISPRLISDALMKFLSL